MQAAGPQSGAFVYDLDAGDSLFELRADVRRPPASVEKLYTTVALLRILGPNARLHTDVLGTGSLAQAASGTGTCTCAAAAIRRSATGAFNRGLGARLRPDRRTQLVNQLDGDGIKRVTGCVYADESLFDRRRGGLMTNYAPDIPDFGGQLSALTYDHGSALKRVGPAEFAARELVLTMRGARIAARASQHTATTPPQAQLLAIVNSPPLSVMTRLMDVPVRRLCSPSCSPSSSASGSAPGRHASRRRARDLGRRSAPYGAAPEDRRRLRPVAQRPLLAAGGRRPAAERSGTRRSATHTRGVAADRRRSTAPSRRRAQDRRGQGAASPRPARSNDVTNLAGYCQSRSGHTLAFALLIDGPPNWTAISCSRAGWSRAIAQLLTTVARRSPRPGQSHRGGDQSAAEPARAPALPGARR